MCATIQQTTLFCAGDVRHVFSTTDLDQLIRLGNDGGSVSPFADLAPRSMGAPSQSASRSRSNSKYNNRNPYISKNGSRVPSLRNFSRVGSSSSIQTGAHAKRVCDTVHSRVLYYRWSLHVCYCPILCNFYKIPSFYPPSLTCM